MTHSQFPPAEQFKTGVEPEIVRNSVGIEHADVIIAVLGQAFKAAHKYAFSE
jgi:cystathionine beta-lyase/cystathionine gamma-synthase